MLIFFPRGVLDEFLNLIESVSEGFPSYFFFKLRRFRNLAMLYILPGNHLPVSALRTPYLTVLWASGRSILLICYRILFTLVDFIKTC